MPDRYGPAFDVGPRTAVECADCGAWVGIDLTRRHDVHHAALHAHLADTDGHT